MIEVSEKYQPIFDLPKGVSTYIITGGRNSQKSFATGLATCINSVTKNHRVLYTRYTLTSAEDSIIPEFTEKTEILEWQNYFKKTKDRIIVKGKKGKIVFKGILSSRGNQTASLKSLKDFSMFVLEEAEEMPNYEDWDKIRKSIRSVDVDPVCMLILNPATKEHWIHEKFFEEKGVKPGFNGIVGDVCYIHTSYLDMPRQFIPDSIFDEYEAHRINYEHVESIPKKDRDMIEKHVLKSWAYYKYSVLGGWLEKSEGVIYEDWEIGEFDESLNCIYGLDFGSNDPDACTKVAVDESAKKIYLKEILFRNGLSTDILAKLLEKLVGKKELIIADSAGKRTIGDLRNLGFEIERCIKGPGSVESGIKKLQGFTLVVTPDSLNLHRALNNYHWAVKKIGIPNHEWSDLCDSFRYAAIRLLAKNSTFETTESLSELGINY